MNAHTYTRGILSATLMISGFSAINAQEPDKATPVATEKKSEPLTAEDLASRKASIPLIEERIKDRKQEISIISDDMKRINKHIESRIDKIISTLAKMKDSQNSKTRVAKMKQDTMKGLYRTIEDYNKRRAELKEELRTGKAAVGTKAATKGVEMFDAKIEKRAAQMVELSKSFTEHVDYKKYVNDNSGGRYSNNNNGWGWDNTRTSEKWKQNRRETTFTEGQRKKMIAALKTSIDDLNRRNNTMRNKSKESGVSEETKKFYQEDIARNETAIATRSKQLGDLMQPGNSPSTASVSRNQAHDTELMIREISADIRRDGNALTRKYNELKLEITKLHRTKENLKARKTWLEKYEAGQGKATE